MKTIDVNSIINVAIAIVLLALAGIGYFHTVRDMGGQQEVEHPRFYLDAEYNVICYTYKTGVDCLPYNDEGTHLEPFNTPEEQENEGEYSI